MGTQEKDTLLEFGERLRKLRKEAGFSQEAFAHECGLDRTYVSGIERGKRNVSLRNLKLLSQRLGISLSKLLEGV